MADGLGAYLRDLFVRLPLPTNLGRELLQCEKDLQRIDLRPVTNGTTVEHKMPVQLATERRGR